mmetsp:Transcript_36875/g.115434  ORF Transcript_36875/g.115434 Transcript_36875/m.115434 type:complete len:174 (+) Transcript_36875:627-1148(+)
MNGSREDGEGPSVANVAVFDLATGQLDGERYARCHKTTASDLDVTPDGSLVVAAARGDSANLFLFDPELRCSVRELEGHSAHTMGVFKVAFVPGQDLVASAGADGTVRIHSTTSGDSFQVIVNALNGKRVTALCATTLPAAEDEDEAAGKACIIYGGNDFDEREIAVRFWVQQ